MNRVCFTGTVKDISDIKKNKAGIDTIKFTLSISYNEKDKKDEPVINAYGETAREISNKLKPGNLIYFEGEFHTGKFGPYITPTKIERMLGNKSEPDDIMLEDSNKEKENSKVWAKLP